MLLIGGKNLVPLVSAAVIQSLGWRWVFIIVGIIVAVMFVFTYLCVPETGWDRTPVTADRLRRQASRTSIPRIRDGTKESDSASEDDKKREEGTPGSAGRVMTPIPAPTVRFALEGTAGERPAMATVVGADPEKMRRSKSESTLHGLGGGAGGMEVGLTLPAASPQALDLATTTVPGGVSRSTSHLSLHRNRSSHSLRRLEKQEYAFQVPPQDIEPIPSGASQHSVASTHEDIPIDQEVGYRFRKKTYREMLKVYQGRISTEKWWKAALRPFILYAYPAIAFVLNNPSSTTNCEGYITVLLERGMAYRPFRSRRTNLPSWVSPSKHSSLI